jgi:DNA-binding CsgD family transcriptional regulator
MSTWGEERNERPRLLMARHVAGVHALAHGDAATALRELRAGLAIADRAGQAHPGVVPVLPDAVEAAAALGQPGAAAELSARLGAQARALRLPWVDAAAGRGRGLAALAAGDGAAAGHLADAANAFEDLGYVLDAARAARWHGLALLRTGHRGTAASVLAAARERLHTLGARPWAAATASVAGPRVLTDAERHVVDLVAAGRRNREIAAELHVSVATVEATLTRVYRAAGVRSRAELARWAADPSRVLASASDTVGQ